MPPGNTWLWKAGECKTLQVASSLPSLRVWGRTECDEDFNCVTGSCRVEGNGGCVSAGEAPCSLWEATLQEHCTQTPVAGMVSFYLLFILFIYFIYLCTMVFCLFILFIYF